MPTAALKPCKFPGCQALVASGRCAEHAGLVAKDPIRRQPWDRNKQTQRLYDRRWQRRRVRQLAEHPWCGDCLDDGVYSPATDVHHEVRHRGDAAVFWSSPLLSLCHECHSRRTASEVRVAKVRGTRGGSKLPKWETSSAVGHSRGKNSQCGEIRIKGEFLE